jgi:hypothetical protein
MGELSRSVPVPDPAGMAALLNQATRGLATTRVGGCPVALAGWDAIVFTHPTGTTTVEVNWVGRTDCRLATSTSASGVWRPSGAALAAIDVLDPPRKG